MKGLYFLICLLIPFYSIHAQDKIQTKDGRELNVRILQEGKKEIVFYFFDDVDKKHETMSKKEIKKFSLEKQPYDTNLIIIEHDSISGDDLYTDMIGYLITSGYELEGFKQEESSVSTKYTNSYRITIIIEDNLAKFQCFYAESNENTYPPISGRFYYGSDANTGEQIGELKSRAFKAMDKLCRAYLLKNKASISYSKL